MIGFLCAGTVGSNYPSKPIELFKNKEDEELSIKNSEEEIKERQILREEYIKFFRAGLRGELQNGGNKNG